MLVAYFFSKKIVYHHSTSKIQPVVHLIMQPVVYFVNSMHNSMIYKTENGMIEITPFPENNYETVLLDRPIGSLFFYKYGLPRSLRSLAMTAF